MPDKLRLEDILKRLRRAGEDREVTVGDVVGAFKQRGFGPLLIAPGLIALLPTGAIPGVPAVCGLLIILISANLLFGSGQPWVPGRLRHMSIRRERLRRAVDRALPYAQKVDRLIKPRWESLTGPAAQRLLAVLSILMALGMITLGFIPFAVALPSAAVVLIGLSLSSDDGLLAALALALAVVTGWLVLQGA